MAMARTRQQSLAPLLLLLPFLLLFSATTRVSSIGVNYGTLANNLPPPAVVAAFLRDHTTIDRVKFFDSNPDLIRAFANTNISVTITLPDGNIPAVADLAAARVWVAQNVVPFVPQTKISLLAVGNEILHNGNRAFITNLLPAMRSIHTALLEANLSYIGVTSPHSLGILAASDPPSAGRFRWVYARNILVPMLEFHKQTGSPFMVNVYPYFGYNGDTLNYALFRRNPGKKDPATGLTYRNLFDAQIDAVFSAMRSLGYGNVQIAVGETGWPWEAERGQAGVSVLHAQIFNRNLINHVSSGRGTPLMRRRRFETYVFALFNENMKPGPNAERHFGLFNADLTPVYNAGIMRDPSMVPPMSRGKKWCVVKFGASAEALQANINYACANGAECSQIQEGGPCFPIEPFSLHASFAMNSYYQKSGRNDFNCDFGQTGVVTTTNPSRGNCTFPA